jgi:hypothetical protein
MVFQCVSEQKLGLSDCSSLGSFLSTSEYFYAKVLSASGLCDLKMSDVNSNGLNVYDLSLYRPNSCC